MQPAGLLSIVFLSKQNVKICFLLVSREREQQSMIHFIFRAASKSKFLIFSVYTAVMDPFLKRSNRGIILNSVINNSEQEAISKFSTQSG